MAVSCSRRTLLNGVSQSAGDGTFIFPAMAGVVSRLSHHVAGQCSDRNWKRLSMLGLYAERKEESKTKT